MSFDDIIIGGGSAGLTLAARLSEEPSRRILVIEAGADFTEATEADHLHGINFALTQRDWGLNATVAPGPGSAVFPGESGRWRIGRQWWFVHSRRAGRLRRMGRRGQ